MRQSSLHAHTAIDQLKIQRTIQADGGSQRNSAGQKRKTGPSRSMRKNENILNLTF